MKRLEGEPEIIRLAAGLEVDWQKNAVKSILSLCHRKIGTWIKADGKIRSISDLQKLVCRKLKLVFEEVWSDEDLKKVIRKYVQLGEPIFATLKSDLDEQTFATLIERRKVTGESQDRYVAVIDCRGSKSARRFFTRWHEIAHLLTLQGQLELPLHRSTIEQTPTERLMDLIAGEVGFYEPMFAPILQDVLSESDELTFEIVDRVRQRYAPEASFHATLNACLRRVSTPTLLLELRLGLKAQEKRDLQSKQQTFFSKEKPQPVLRVATLVANEAAQVENFRIHRNMRVPEGSALHRLFFDPNGENSQITSDENLKLWSSAGRFLPDCPVRIRARRYEDSILALVVAL